MHEQLTEKGDVIVHKVKNLNHVLNEKKPRTDFIMRVADVLGTSKFILGLTTFLILWIGGNCLSAYYFHKSIDPSPFLLISTTINIYSAYTISVLLKADRTQREIANDHEAEIRQKQIDYLSTILKEIRESRREIKMTVIQTACDFPHNHNKESQNNDNTSA